MRVVYNQENTIKRINQIGSYIIAREKRSKKIVNRNLLSLSILLIFLLYLFANNQAVNVVGFVIISLSVLCNIISTIFAYKSVPNAFDISPPDVWYHLIKNEYQVLEVKAEKIEKEKKYFITLVFKDDKDRIIHGELGMMEVREKEDLAEEYLDLEECIVYIPAQQTEEKYEK